MRVVLLAALVGLADLFSLSCEKLRKIHRLRENDIVLVELNAAASLSLVSLVSVNLEAQFLLSEDHVGGVVSHAHLTNLLALNVARVVHSHI